MRWQYAKTYPKAPHEYTLFDWSTNKEDFKLLVNAILSSNDFEYYYRKRYQILIIGDYKYWVMDDDISKVTLVNRTFFNNAVRDKIMKFVCSPMFIHKKGMTMEDIIKEIELAGQI